MTKVLVVDDEIPEQRHLSEILYSSFSGSVTLQCANNGKEAVAQATLWNPDIVLMDIGLPDISGIDATKKIMELNIPNVKVVILTARVSEDEIFNSLSAGAFGYIMKDINTEQLMVILKTIKNGAMWIDPQVVPFIKDKNCGVIPPRQLSRAGFRETHSNLTQREYEVLKLVVDGQTNSEIAKTLTISEHTAKAHVCNIIQKLVVDDRTQAAVKALKEGLV